MATKVDEHYIREALKEAERALASREKPVGSVIVHRNKIIARAHHQTKTLGDPTAHAVMIAITQAANASQSTQMKNATLYATQEPCSMCMGAVFLSGIGRLVIGAEDPKQGACGSAVDLPANERINRRLSVVRGVLTPECATILRKGAVSARV